VVLKDPIPFHQGTSGSNPLRSTGESATNRLLISPPMGDSGGSACPSRRCRDIDRATDATNPVSQLSCAGIIVVPTTGREKNPCRGRCPF
jgi:hypothetical protein